LPDVEPFLSEAWRLSNALRVRIPRKYARWLANPGAAV
jgi:hypothetical protein